MTLADVPHTDVASLPLLERCAGAVPDDAELQADLGAAYEAASRTGDAERALRRALTVDPDFAEVHLRLATLLAARGATSEAREHAEAALRLQPNRTAVQQLISRLGTPTEHQQ